MKRVGIYVRTSTQEQNSDLQKDELIEYVKARGWQFSKIYEDKLSGTHLQRPAFRELLTNARLRKIDIVLVWKLDRAFRSLKDMVNVIQEFTDLNVEFVSLKDNIDLTTTTGRLLAHLLGAFAEFEASLCRERVMAGLDAAKRRGKKLGRPRSVDFAKICELRRTGYTYKQIINDLGVSPGSISIALARFGAKSNEP